MIDIKKRGEFILYSTPRRFAKYRIHAESNPLFYEIGHFKGLQDLGRQIAVMTRNAPGKRLYIYKPEIPDHTSTRRYKNYVLCASEITEDDIENILTRNWGTR